MEQTSPHDSEDQVFSPAVGLEESVSPHRGERHFGARVLDPGDLSDTYPE